jgi:hypothetical protein
MVIFCQIIHPKEWQLDSCKPWDCYSQGDKHEIWAGQGWRYTRVWKLVGKNIMKHLKQIITRKSGNNHGHREKLCSWKLTFTWESSLYLSNACKIYGFRPYKIIWGNLTVVGINQQSHANSWIWNSQFMIKKKYKKNSLVLYFVIHQWTSNSHK